MYFVLKSLHILSVVIFLGNIITGVFWKMHGDRVGTATARAQALDGVIHSDRWFTLPGVLAIIITGVVLALTQGYPLLRTKWILWSIILFGISWSHGVSQDLVLAYFFTIFLVTIGETLADADDPRPLPVITVVDAHPAARSGSAGRGSSGRSAA